MITPGDPAAPDGVLLMGDPRVTAIPVSDDGEGLTDLRDRGFGMSALVADDAGNYAHVRAGLAARLAQAQEALPRGIRLLLVAGHRRRHRALRARHPVLTA